MPQMYPLVWVFMMPFSILVMFVYLIYIFYMKLWNVLSMVKLSKFKNMILWEW